METCIAHHGVLGMKWGVRRYQNKDGSLTSEGRMRFNKVASSGIKKMKDTSRARYTYKNNARNFEGFSKSYARKSVKEQKKSEKYAKGTSENKKHLEKSKEYKKLSDEFFKASDISYKKLADLNSKKIEAGKDFIVQKDVNVNIFTFTGVNNMAKTVYEKNPNKITKLSPYVGYVDYRIIEKRKK